jgi:O-methyltransferase involved in polyketide biosynthesis
VELISVELSGVPETLLGNLGRRAEAARNGALEDPVAIEIVGRLDYDFAEFARGARVHAVRVATFDAAVCHFLGAHPAGTVVALGEGLETQFWRLDNGQVRWLTVDLPETLELRHRLLPEGPRQSSHSGSALDLQWLDGLNPADPILVTAQGLLPYFQRDQVHRLIAGIAERLPGSLLVFDVVPEMTLEMVRRASGRERDLAVELWTWLFSPGERRHQRDPFRREATGPRPAADSRRHIAGDRCHRSTPAARTLLTTSDPGPASQLPRRSRALKYASKTRSWLPPATHG